MVKPPLRTKSIGFKVSEEEYAQLETAAQKSGQTLGEWCREAAVLGSANGEPAQAATGGNQSLAAVATTTGDVAGLVGKPEGAVGVVDKISTAVGLATGGLKDTYETIRNFVSPPLPPPPPTPGLPPN